MDRIITDRKQTAISFLKEFEYLDLFPYTLALVMVLGEIYILNAFITIADSMR